MSTLDLTPIPLVDNHCHAIYREQEPADHAAWHRHFTEAHDPAPSYVTTTLFYHRLLHAMADLFDCAATEEAVLAARQVYDTPALVQHYLQTANVAALLLDRGYPARELTLSDDEHAQLVRCQVRPMLRVELLMQDLIANYTTLADVIEGLKAALQDVRRQGYVALKSIVAYRTGLNIQSWTPNEAQGAFMQARQEVVQTGSVRLIHKPLLDTLLHVTFTEAARQALPIQFHTGYGDTDADMLLANPLHLRAVLERQEYRAMPVVLLHAAYLYTAQAAYLAAVYPHVYLDLSYGIPFLGYHEMLTFTRTACDIAPYAKLLYSSDGVGVPEIHWLSARDGRRILGQVLGERIASGELRSALAEKAGAAILRDNALQLYRL